MSLSFDWIATLAYFLYKRGWSQKCCVSCGETYFQKKRKVTSTTHNCTWRGCGGSSEIFRTLSKRKRPMPIWRLVSILETAIVGSGYVKTQPLHIANTHGTTDLVVAGVQVFDGVIHKGLPIQESKCSILQPSIRMQFQEQVATSDGVATSFVNACTCHADATFDDHLNAIDAWIGALSRAGLYADDLTLVCREKTVDWGTGAFTAHNLFFVYGGLELGDGTYLVVPRHERPALAISDVGFGLERLAWAVNKTESYWDLIRPLTIKANVELVDICRTLALLTLSGIRPGNKGPGLQLRRLAGVLAERYPYKSWHDVVLSAMTHWQQFVTNPIASDEARTVVSLEVDRLLGVKLQKALALPTMRARESLQDYGARMVYTEGVDPVRIRTYLGQ